VRTVQWVRAHSVAMIAALALGFLFLPIVIVVLFSFNNPTGRFNYQWTRFSTDAWTNVCSAPGMCESLKLSLKIGILATVGATLLGTLMAFALGRHRFRGRS
jgi:spermidine/putrescine transport system permease protein